MRVPTSTYRVQANSSFTFRRVQGLVGYLCSLGAGDLYCSPVLSAKAGSVHCYDVVDPAAVNPELGGEEGLKSLSMALRKKGMGLLLDIVPNHMSTSMQNPYWADVLEYGRKSPFAPMFDIDWDPPERELKGKILLPRLPCTLAEAVSSGQVSLGIGRGTRPLVVRVGGEELPLSASGFREVARLFAARGLAPETGSKSPSAFAAAILSAPDDEGRLAFEATKVMAAERLRRDPGLRRKVQIVLSHSKAGTVKVLTNENYLLAHWKEAETKINYRRFLNVNDLVAVRVEDVRIFRMTHRVILALLGSQNADGLRVDHADGLRDPEGYFRRLATELRRTPSGEAYVVAEKILPKGRKLPSEWQVSGTTGYGFMNELNRIFVKAENTTKFDDIYRRFTGNQESFESSVYQGKLLAIGTMRSELRRLASLLSESGARGGKRGLEVAIREVAAGFDGYRTYTSPRARTVSGTAKERIERAVRRARLRRAEPMELGTVRDALLLKKARSLSPLRKKALMEFVLRFQQFTAAVAVKGEEDTALYRYDRLASLNEVGGDPREFGESVNEFHWHNLARARDWPHSMIATSTHDTKRSEDVRARLNVLSEVPEEWESSILKWREVTKEGTGTGRGMISKNDEYLFYQTVLGAWPHPPIDRPTLVRRLQGYMMKATKEERKDTGWTTPDPRYDRAVSRFVRGCLRNGSAFMDEFADIQKRVDWFGMLNSLSQALIKFTAPGVPDVYQGNELWDYSLVDPDNRRPVDFESRERMLRDLDGLVAVGGPRAGARRALERLPSGMAKLYLTSTALRYRSRHRELLGEGGYVPLSVAGSRQQNLVAFARVSREGACVICAPRFFTELCDAGELPLGERTWGRTVISLPEGRWRKYVDVFTGRRLEARKGRKGRRIAAAEVFADFPVGLVDLR